MLGTGHPFQMLQQLEFREAAITSINSDNVTTFTVTCIIVVFVISVYLLSIKTLDKIIGHCISVN